MLVFSIFVHYHALFCTCMWTIFARFKVVKMVSNLSSGMEDVATLHVIILNFSLVGKTENY